MATQYIYILRVVYWPCYVPHNIRCLCHPSKYWQFRECHRLLFSSYYFGWLLFLLPIIDF